MSTYVKYGNVTIWNAHVRNWEQTVQMDSSNTDAQFTRISFRVDGVVHAQNHDSDIGAGGKSATCGVYADDSKFESATSTYCDITSTLSLPRQELIVRLKDLADSGEGETLLVCRSSQPDLNPEWKSDPHRDVDNGPRPRVLAITMIAGTSAYRVSVTFECAKVLCLRSVGTTTVPAVLNNRWSVEESMSENFFITRTITGDMRLSAPVYFLQDDYKRFATPPLEKGFRRQSITFTPNKNGLDCSYTVVDVQTHDAPPFPATKIEGTHTESTSANGTVQHSEMSVRLHGAPHTSKRLLILRAIDVIESRLKFIELQAGGGVSEGSPNGVFLESATISDTIGDANVVEAKVRLKRMGDLRLYFGNLLDGQIGTPLQDLMKFDSQNDEYDPLVSPTPAIYGYVPHSGERRPAVLLMLACYYQQPCVGGGAIEATSNGAGPVGTASGPVTPIYEQSQSDDQLTATAQKKQKESTNTSESSQQAIYTYARLESSYKTQKSVVQLPIARAKPQSSSTSGGTGQSDTTASQQNSGPVDESDTCFFAALSQGVCRRRIEADFERIGEWPEVFEAVETYTDGKLKGRLLACELTPLAPTLGPDQKQNVYRIHAVYVYGLNRPPNRYETFNVGVLPFTKYEQKDTAFNPQNSYTPRLGP